MGVEEIIWDCGYWGAGMPAFRPYSECFAERRQPAPPREPDARPTSDHVHLGLTVAGAMGRTSFWTGRR